MKTSYHVGIAATGMILPKRSYTNQDIITYIKQANKDKQIPDLKPAWIEDNIGIKTRYFFGEDESLIEVSVKACLQALKKASWDASDLDFVIFSSISTHCDDQAGAIPSSACLVQEKLQAYNAFAYDTSAACSGWTYGLTQGVAHIESGFCKKGVIICSEKQLKGLDFSNHISSVLIGDVATATLLEKSATPKTKSVFLQANTGKQLSHIITLPYFRQTNEQAASVGFFALKGRTVFKEGTQTMVSLTQKALETNKLSVDDIDWFIYHQANGAMLRMVGKKVGIESKKNLQNIEVLGNTTAGTIPSVLHMHLESGLIKRGHKICCVSFGGGLTSGYVVFTY